MIPTGSVSLGTVAVYSGTPNPKTETLGSDSFPELPRVQIIKDIFIILYLSAIVNPELFS